MSTSPPKGHPLHAIRQLTVAALSELWQATSPPRLPGRRPDAADEILRALLLQSLYSIPNERRLGERLRDDPQSRWFVAAGKAHRPWTPGTFSLARARLFATGIAPTFFQSLLKRPAVATLLLDDRLDVDAKLLQAWAGQEGWRASRYGTGELSSLLILPEVPDAMRYLPYLEERPGGVPLEPVLRRLRDGLQGALSVTCWSEAMATRLAPVVERCDAQVLLLEPGPQLTQLVSAAAKLHAAHLAIWDAGAALLPSGLIQRLCQHHLRHCNDVTRVMLLPEGARAEIFSTCCLHRLQAEAPTSVDFTHGGFLDWANGVASRRARLEDLRSAGWPEPIPADLPRHVAVAELDDWVRLADSLTRDRALLDADVWQPLRAWRNADWRRPAGVARRVARPAGRRSRVLFVTPSTAFTGPERMYARLANGLLDRGVDLWGLVVQPGMIASLLKPAYRDRLLSDGVEFGRPTLRSFDYCLDVVRRMRPAVIHCNGVAAWPMLAAAEVCRIAVVQHVRVAAVAGLEDRLSRAQRLLAVSRFVERELLRVGADPERVRVCYDGVDVIELRRSVTARVAGRRLFRLDADAFVLLCLARCDRSKRIEVVIRAFAEAARVRRNACLLVVGEIDDPRYFESLKLMVAERGLGPRVRFLHAVEDIRLLHAAADALMLASVDEPLGSAVLEAMAMQTPVVASASGGIPEILDDSCGTLVDPDSVDEFGAALRRVAMGDAELLQKARRARHVVERRFNLDDHIEAMRRHYLEVAG